jgi:hypothetical protein
MNKERGFTSRRERNIPECQCLLRGSFSRCWFSCPGGISLFLVGLLSNMPAMTVESLARFQGNIFLAVFVPLLAGRDGLPAVF